MRRNHRPDANAEELYRIAEQMGFQVERIGRPTDALVGRHGIWHVVEVKSAQGTYTPAQERFLARCDRHGNPVLTWRTVDDIKACLEGV